MTLLALLFTTLIASVHAANPSVATPTPAAPAAPELTADLPMGPTTKDKLKEYSIRTTIETCTPSRPEACLIDTLVVAKELTNQYLTWERRIYFQHYDLEKPIDPQIIAVKSMKLFGKKILVVKNARGDSFEIELDRGHMKKPKNPREYSK